MDRRLVELQDTYAVKVASLGLEPGGLGNAIEQTSTAAVEIETQALLVPRVERQELQIAEQAQREQMSKALLAHLREVDISKVMMALGGDRLDRHQWLLDGEVISITGGEKFYNQTRKQDGEGAVDLVMHAGYDYKQAIAYLSNQVGIDVAIVAAARNAMVIAQRATRQKREEPARMLRESEARDERPQ